MARADVSVRNGALTLPELAERINTFHGAVESAWGSALDHAREAGRLLQEAKDQVRHGEWLPWLEANFHGAERTAQVYMRIAARWEEIKSAKSADLVRGIDGAIRLLAEVRETNGGEPDDEEPARTPVSRATPASEPATNGATATETVGRRKPEPEPLPEGIEPDDTDPLEALQQTAEQLMRDNDRLTAEVEALTADDKDRKIRELSGKCAQYNALLSDRDATLGKEREFSQRRHRLLSKCAKLMGVEDYWRELYPAIEALKAG